MLYGGVAWSELPISTTKQQEPNGEIFDFGFIIDQYCESQIALDTGNDIVLEIQQGEAWNFDIAQLSEDTFTIEPLILLTLEIDENNIWSL